jgi:hypothetical protein
VNRYSTRALKFGVKHIPNQVAIVGDREPHVVIRGKIGDMGAARVRIGANTQVDAAKLCAALRAARTYCDVLRN